MAFEEETQQQDEEVTQLQKQRENDQFQHELDEIIARLENEQFQKELDEIIERLEHKSQEHEEDMSFHESDSEEELEQQNILEKLSTTNSDNHDEEITEEEQTQNQEFTEIEDSLQDSIKSQEIDQNMLQEEEEHPITEHLDHVSQQSPPVEEEFSSHESATEEKSDKQNALEQTIYTFDELASQHEEYLEEQQIQLDLTKTRDIGRDQEIELDLLQKGEENKQFQQELALIKEHFDQKIPQYEKNTEDQVMKDQTSQQPSSLKKDLEMKERLDVENPVEIQNNNNNIEEKQTERDHNTSIRIIKDKYLEDQTKSNQDKKDLKCLQYEKEKDLNDLYVRHFNYFNQPFSPLTQILSLRHNRLNQGEYFWNYNLSNLQNNANKSMREFLESYNKFKDSVKGISFNNWSDKQKTSVSTIVKSHDKELSRILERSKLIGEFYGEISAINHLPLIDNNQEIKLRKEIFFSSIKENNNLEGAIITTKYGVEIFSHNNSKFETYFQLLAEMSKSDKIDSLKVRSIKQLMLNGVFTDLLTKMDEEKQKQVIEALVNSKLLNKDTFRGFDFIVNIYGEEGILSIEDINFPCPSKDTPFLTKKNISYQYLPGAAKSILGSAGPQNLMMWKKSGDWICENWLSKMNFMNMIVGEKVAITTEDSRVRKVELELLQDNKLRVYVWGKGTGRNKDRRKNAIRYISDKKRAGIGYYHENTRVREDRGGRTENSVQLIGLQNRQIGKKTYFHNFFSKDVPYKTGQSIIIDLNKYFEFLNEVETEITRISILMELRQKRVITGVELRGMDGNFSQYFHRLAKGGWWTEYTEHGSWNGILEDDEVYQFFNKQFHPFSIANPVNKISKEILNTCIIHRKSIKGNVAIKELLKNYKGKFVYFPSNKKASKLIKPSKSELKKIQSLKNESGVFIKVEQCLSGQGGTIVSGRDILNLGNEKKGAITVFSNSLVNTTGKNKDYSISGKNHPLCTILGLNQKQIDEGRDTISRKYEDARIKENFDILAPDVVIIDNKTENIIGLNQVKGKTATNEGFLPNSTIVQLMELDLLQHITNIKVAFIEIDEFKVRKKERGIVYNWVTFEQDGKIKQKELNELVLQNLIMREIRHSDFISKVYTDVVMSADKRSEHIQTLERVIKYNKESKEFAFQRTKNTVRNFDNIYKTSLSNEYSSELFNQTYNGIADQLLATETITDTKWLANKTGLLEYPSFKYNFQKRVIADWWIPLIREYYYNL